VSSRDVIWQEVAKVNCLDCFHPECLAIADAAEALVRLIESDVRYRE
jgi:hypothetical protein